MGCTKKLDKGINIDETVRSKYVSGVRKQRMDILVNIARIFFVSVEYLATGRDKMKILILFNN